MAHESNSHLAVLSNSGLTSSFFLLPTSVLLFNTLNIGVVSKGMLLSYYNHVLNQWQCLVLTFTFSVAISLFLSSPAYNKWMGQRKKFETVCWRISCLFFTLTMINNSSFILSDVCWKVKRQSSENESVSVVLVLISWRNRLHSPQLLTHSSSPPHEISNITVC